MRLLYLLNKIYRRTVRFLVVSMISLALLIVAGVLLLQVPEVQNWAAQKVVQRVENKLNTEVAVERITFDFNGINFKDIYIADQKQDIQW